MIYTNIIIPKNPICSSFNIIISFSEFITALGLNNVILSGDTNGVTYNIYGEGCCWTLQINLPQDSQGQLIIRLNGQVTKSNNKDIVDIEQNEVILNYDTCNIITATWGDIIKTKEKIILPITFSLPIAVLPKEFFRITTAQNKFIKFQVYGTGDNMLFNIHLYPPHNLTDTIYVSLIHSIIKTNGVELTVDIIDKTIEIL